MEDRIKEYLNSDDYEMIQLGVTLIEQNYPQDQWAITVVTLMTAGEPHRVSARRGSYTIHRDDREVYELLVTPQGMHISRIVSSYDFGTIDLWAMKQKTNAPLLQMANIQISNITYTDNEFTYAVPYTK